MTKKRYTPAQISAFSEGVSAGNFAAAYVGSSNPENPGGVEGQRSAQCRYLYSEGYFLGWYSTYETREIPDPDHADRVWEARNSKEMQRLATLANAGIGEPESPSEAVARLLPNGNIQDAINALIGVSDPMALVWEVLELQSLLSKEEINTLAKAVSVRLP